LLILLFSELVSPGAFYRTLFNQDLTGATNTGTTAGSINMHPGSNSRLKEIGARFDGNLNVIGVEVDLYPFAWLLPLQSNLFYSQVQLMND